MLTSYLHHTRSRRSCNPPIGQDCEERHEIYITKPHPDRRRYYPVSTATSRESEYAPRIGDYDQRKFNEWYARHGQRFSKEFNLMLTRRMRNPKVDQDSRVLSWVVLHSSGNDSDWCVDGHARILKQTDCATDTLLERQRVSESLARLEAREEVWLARDGTGRIYQMDGAPDRRINGEPLSETSGQIERKLLKTIEQNWRHENEPLLAKREAAAKRIDEVMTRAREQIQHERETVKAIDLQMLSDCQRELKRRLKAEQRGQNDATELSEASGQSVRDVPDTLSETGRTETWPDIITKPEEELEDTSSSSLRFVVVEETTTTGSNDFPRTAETIAKVTGSREHDVVESLVRSCQQQRPDATDDEIAAKVHEKAVVIRKAGNPSGLLLTAVPKTFSGAEFLRWREDRKRQAERIQTTTEWKKEPEPAPDPVVERTECRKCGGVIERYQSGMVAPCACRAGRRAGVSA
jgi:hypothetical protein